MIGHSTLACRALLKRTLPAVAAIALAGAGPAFAWEPTKPVEFVVPAGTGGGADQMARLIQGIVVKHKLMKESMIVVNKSGGAGAKMRRATTAAILSICVMFRTAKSGRAVFSPRGVNRKDTKPHFLKTRSLSHAAKTAFRPARRSSFRPKTTQRFAAFQ